MGGWAVVGANLGDDNSCACMIRAFIFVHAN